MTTSNLRLKKILLLLLMFVVNSAQIFDLIWVK